MRVTFERGVECTFFAVLIGLIVVAITMVVNAKSWEAPYKPESLAEWDQRDITTTIEEHQPSITKIEILVQEKFEPPPGGEGTPLPADTPTLNSKPANLLNFLHHYYFLDRERMLTESVEYVDRTSGYIKTGIKGGIYYQLDYVGKHIKYLLVLVKHKYLHPTLRLFDEDLLRMNDLVREIFETHPAGTRYTEESFFDLLELAELTGEKRYLEYADYVNGVGNLRNLGETQALLEQRRAARSFMPSYLNLVNVLQYYADHGDPLLIHSAGTLFDGLMAAIYDSKAKLFYTKATYGQPGNSSLSAIETYKTSELAVGLLRLLEYYESTGNEEVLSYAEQIVRSIQYGESLIMDREHGLFYSKFLHKGSDFKTDDKRADVNLLLYGALFQFFRYDNSNEYYRFMRDIFALIDDIAYDDIYNGFYTRYAEDWQPLEDNGIYRLSVTDALIGTQVFLNNQEVTDYNRDQAQVAE